MLGTSTHLTLIPSFFLLVLFNEKHNTYFQQPFWKWNEIKLRARVLRFYSLTDENPKLVQFFQFVLVF